MIVTVDFSFWGKNIKTNGTGDTQREAARLLFIFDTPGAHEVGFQFSFMLQLSVSWTGKLCSNSCSAGIGITSLWSLGMWNRII